MSNPDTPLSQPSVTPQALLAIAPLVTWLVRSGVGYSEFAAALKPVFLQAAKDEQQRIGGKPTDSALALLSGLHRKDVRLLGGRRRAPDSVAQDITQLGRPTAASQVVTRWLAQGLPDQMPFAGEQGSFEALARAVSSDIHPRTVLLELVRLGIVAESEAGQVSLQRSAFVPDRQHVEARALLAGSVADHLAAGVHNLTSGESRRFLEQSVFADGLSEQSAQELQQLANQLWRDALGVMVKAAVPLCEKDEPAGGNHRIRLGMFCYAAPMTAQPVTHTAASTDSSRDPS